MASELTSMKLRCTIDTQVTFLLLVSEETHLPVVCFSPNVYYSFKKQCDQFAQELAKSIIRKSNDAEDMQIDIISGVERN